MKRGISHQPVWECMARIMEVSGPDLLKNYQFNTYVSGLAASNSPAPSNAIDASGSIDFDVPGKPDRLWCSRRARAAG